MANDTPAVLPAPPVDSSIAGAPDPSQAPQDSSAVASGLGGGTPPSAPPAPPINTDPNAPAAAGTPNGTIPGSDSGDDDQDAIQKLTVKHYRQALEEQDKPNAKRSVGKTLLLGVLGTIAAGLGGMANPKEATQIGQHYGEMMNPKTYDDEQTAEKDARVTKAAKAFDANATMLRLQQMLGQQTKDRADAGVESDKWMLDGSSEVGGSNMTEKDTAAFLRAHPNEGWLVARDNTTPSVHGKFENTYSVVKPPSQAITDESGKLTEFGQKAVDYGLVPAWRGLDGEKNKTTDPANAVRLHLQIEQADTVEDQAEALGGTKKVGDALKDGSLTRADIRAYANASGANQTAADRIHALAQNATTKGNAQRLEAFFGKDILIDQQHEDEIKQGGYMGKDGSIKGFTPEQLNMMAAQSKYPKTQAAAQAVLDEQKKNKPTPEKNPMAGVDAAGKSRFGYPQDDGTFSSDKEGKKPIAGFHPKEAAEPGSLTLVENGKNDDGSPHMMLLNNKTGELSEPKQGGKTATIQPKGTSEPTGQQKTAAGRARQAVAGIDLVLQDLDDKDGAAGDLGPISGRFNEWYQGDVGASDPKFAALHTDMHMLATQVTLAHAQGRMSDNLYQGFQKLLNSPKQDVKNLKATLGQVRKWMVSQSNPNSPGEPMTNKNEQPKAPADPASQFGGVTRQKQQGQQ